MELKSIEVTSDENEALYALKRSGYRRSFSRYAMNRDWILITRLRSNRLNVREAEESLVRTLEFFERCGIESVWSMEIEKVLGSLGGASIWSLLGRTTNGFPVIKSDWGGFEASRSVSGLSGRVLRDFALFKMEQLVHSVLPLFSELAGWRVERVVVVHDVESFSALRFRESKLETILTELAKDLQTHYPCLLEQFIIINCSAPLEKILQPLLTRLPSEKLYIFRDKGVQHLRSLLDPNPILSLPSLPPSVFLSDRSLEFKWFFGEAALSPSSSPHSQPVQRPLAFRRFSKFEPASNSKLQCPGALIGSTRHLNWTGVPELESLFPKTIQSNFNRKIMPVSIPRASHRVPFSETPPSSSELPEREPLDHWETPDDSLWRDCLRQKNAATRPRPFIKKTEIYPQSPVKKPKVSQKIEAAESVKTESSTLSSSMISLEYFKIKAAFKQLDKFLAF